MVSQSDKTTVYRAVASPAGEDDFSSDFSESEREAMLEAEALLIERNIDLQALADELYALMKQELKLERQRLGRIRR